MYELLIGLRYTRAQRRDGTGNRFISFIALISMLGLALAQGIDAERLPSKFRIPPGRSTLALFDELAAPARLGDALAWRDALAGLEAAWLAPALAALRGGRLDALRLLAPGEPNNVECVVRRGDLWKFWRKPRALMDAFAATESR